MDEIVTFFTDTATLAIFDTQVIKNRLKDDCDWWCCSDFSTIEEVNNGQISLINLGGDGTFTVRFTDKDLNQIERDYARVVLNNLGFEVISSELFIGKGECLSGDDFEVNSNNVGSGEGRIISLEPGQYNIKAYLIDYFESPDYWNAEYITPKGAPPDIALILSKREKVFSGLDYEPRLEPDTDECLFNSSTRKIGPQEGMVLESIVLKTSSGLTLKKCGPMDYKPHMTNFDGLKWKDEVKIKVISVDHDNETMDVEFLGKTRP